MNQDLVYPYIIQRTTVLYDIYIICSCNIVHPLNKCIVLVGTVYVSKYPIYHNYQVTSDSVKVELSRKNDSENLD